MRRALAPMLFVDEDIELSRADRKSPVQPVKPSSRAKAKAARKIDAEGRPIHSFQTLMENLQAIVRNRIQPAIKGIPEFFKETCVDDLQRRAFELLGLEVPGSGR